MGTKMHEKTNIRSFVKLHKKDVNIFVILTNEKIKFFIDKCVILCYNGIRDKKTAPISSGSLIYYINIRAEEKEKYHEKT